MKRCNKKLQKDNQRYVIYDQFHWLCPDHLEMTISGYDYALKVYNFEKNANPDKTLGLVTEEQYKKIKDGLK